MKKIIRDFEQGNVCVSGERGTGKDMLFANVIARRNIEYIANAEYAKKKGLPVKYNHLDFDLIDCGGNTHDNFVRGDIKPYKYPYPLGVDVYITDVGVYFPSQFCSELNRQYRQVPTFMALSRHLGECNVHINVQNLNRAWDKLREQSRTYYTCLSCKVIKLFGQMLVIQRVRKYEKYESCVNNIPQLNIPLRMRIGKDKMLAYLYKLNYKIQHGTIEERTLIYWNKSDYNTHVFREMLEKGGNDEK